MTIEYLLRTILILMTLFATGFYATKIRNLMNWIKVEELFESPSPAMKQIPCFVLTKIVRYTGMILVLLTAVAVLEYGWIVYRYVTPPTPTEYFAYKLPHVPSVEK